MTNPQHLSHGTPDRGSPPLRLPRAAIVLGLGALPLSIPLAQALGVAEQGGRSGVTSVLATLVTVTWVLAVGVGRVPRPLATLTLVGVAAGWYVALAGGVFLLLRGDATPWQVVALFPIMAIQTAWGLLAGLLALGVQRLLGGRR